MDTGNYQNPEADPALRSIASHCTEYEAISEAQGYGFSWLNTAESGVEPSCHWCTHWEGGECAIYSSRITSRSGDSD